MTPVSPKVAAWWHTQVAEPYATHWSPVIRPMGEALVGAIATPDARLVLDLGCGDGQLLGVARSSFPWAAIVGLDVSTGMLRIARRSGMPVVRADAHRLPLRAGCLDRVIAAFVLQMVPHPEVVLSDVVASLRPAGVMGSTTWVGAVRGPDYEVWAEAIHEHGGPEPEAPEIDDGRTSSEEGLSTLFAAGGLEADPIRRIPVRHRWTLQGLMAYREEVTFRVQLSSLAPEARSTCLDRLRVRLAERFPSGWTFENTALLAIARRP